MQWNSHQNCLCPCLLFHSVCAESVCERRYPVPLDRAHKPQHYCYTHTNVHNHSTSYDRSEQCSSPCGAELVVCVSHVPYPRPGWRGLITLVTSPYTMECNVGVTSRWLSVDICIVLTTCDHCDQCDPCVTLCSSDVIVWPADLSSPRPGACTVHTTSGLHSSPP